MVRMNSMRARTTEMEMEMELLWMKSSSQKA